MSSDRSSSAIELHPVVADQVQLAVQQYGPEFDALPLNLTLLLYRFVSLVDRAHALALLPVDLSASQFNVLTVLKRAAGPVQMGKLAKALSVPPPNLTAVVETLRQRELIERAVNPADRRSAIISISPKGDELLLRFLPGHWPFLESLFSGLDQSERETMTGMLSRLLLAAEGDDGSVSGLADSISAAARHAVESDRPTDRTAVRRGRRPGTRFA
jgi:MarR family 2-MHQ and catechol resistance regulon transcriptional repressor